MAKTYIQSFSTATLLSVTVRVTFFGGRNWLQSLSSELVQQVSGSHFLIFTNLAATHMHQFLPSRKNLVISHYSSRHVMKPCGQNLKESGHCLILQLKKKIMTHHKVWLNRLSRQFSVNKLTPRLLDFIIKGYLSLLWARTRSLCNRYVDTLF